MTTKEFKDKYGISYATIKAQINALYDEKKDAHFVKPELRPETRCEGHGIFVPTGRMVIYDKIVPNKKRQNELQKEIDRLEKMIKPVDEEKAKKAEEKAKLAKIKRYTKEIEELKAEIARKEKWLAENA